MIKYVDFNHLTILLIIKRVVYCLKIIIKIGCLIRFIRSKNTKYLLKIEANDNLKL